MLTVTGLFWTIDSDRLRRGDVLRVATVAVNECGKSGWWMTVATDDRVDELTEMLTAQFVRAYVREQKRLWGERIVFAPPVADYDSAFRVETMCRLPTAGAESAVFGIDPWEGQNPLNRQALYAAMREVIAELAPKRRRAVEEE